MGFVQMKKPSAEQGVFFFNNNNFPKFYSIKTYEILERDKFFNIVSQTENNELFLLNYYSINFIQKKGRINFENHFA